MSIPVFVGAGTGLEILVAGTQTVSKTGCTAGNFLMAACFDSDDTGGGAFVSGSSSNVAGLDGTVGAMTSWINSTNRVVQFGRVIADGTCTRDVTLAAGTATTIARMYEFSGVATGGTIANVREASGETGIVTDTTILDRGVTTTGLHRLAINLVNVRASAVIGAFTGETGGDWTEVAQYNGSALSQQLHTAPMTNIGTIDGGTITQASAFWIDSGVALIPLTTSDYASIAWTDA